MTETQQIIALLTEIRDLLKRPAASAPSQRSPDAITYTKLKGDAGWGVRCPRAVKPGEKVQAKTKDGKIRTETIDQVVWQGNDHRTGAHVWVCSIVPRSRGNTESQPTLEPQPEPEPEPAAAPAAEEEQDVPF